MRRSPMMYNSLALELHLDNDGVQKHPVVSFNVSIIKKYESSFAYGYIRPPYYLTESKSGLFHFNF